MSKKIIQTLDLEPDPKLIDFYIDAHSPSKIWPEIIAGIKSVGIINMEIFRFDTRLVMILEVPDDFDFQSSMEKLSLLPKQQEWENYVGRAQKCDKNVSSSGKWKVMDNIFGLNNL